MIGISITRENGITARSAKGRTLFPGSIAASIIVIGTNTRDTESVVGCPIPTAESSPIYIFPLFLNLLLTNSCAESDIGINPSISIAAILGISTSTPPSVIPNTRMPFRLYPAAIPITIPITVPIISGSPNTPNLF